MESDEYLLFSKTIENKEVVLEYGSGGSTIQFINRSKTVYSVESNPEFYKYMRSIHLVNKVIGKSLFMKYIDLGDTDPWGRPVSLDKTENWPGYYSEVWKEILRDGNKVDIIFIDGRFRVACCLFSVLQILGNQWNGTVIMIHDFWNRDEYKILLRFLDELESRSRLGVFTVKADIDADMVKTELEKYSSTFQ